MAQVRLDISMSLDGFVAGPEPTLEEPLGVGGERLHEWVFGLKSFRENHGMTGRRDEPRRRDRGRGPCARRGAVVMGRKMFSGGSGPGRTIRMPTAGGATSRRSACRSSCSRITRASRKVMQGGTTFIFVTDGIESALEQARAVAGDKDVLIAGGGEVAQQYLRGRAARRDAGARRAGLPRRRRPPLRRHSARHGRAGSGAGGRLAERHPSPLPRDPLTARLGPGPTCACSIGARPQLSSAFV